MSVICGRRRARGLASATFTGESASGWQQVNFSSPVAVSGEHDLHRVVSRAGGSLRVRRGRLPSAGVDSGPLHAPANSVTANGSTVGDVERVPGSDVRGGELLGGRGVLDRGRAGHDAADGGVDIAGGGDVGVTRWGWHRATFSEAVQSATVSFDADGPGGAVAGRGVLRQRVELVGVHAVGVRFDRRATYTATVSGAKDAAGNTMTSPITGPSPPRRRSGPVRIRCGRRRWCRGRRRRVIRRR